MNYGYRSGLNASMVRHLHSKVAKILTLDVLEPGDLVIDIGSNDATTLRAYPENHFQLVGIDPTGIKFSSYYPAEIALIPNFFLPTLYQRHYQAKRPKSLPHSQCFMIWKTPLLLREKLRHL